MKKLFSYYKVLLIAVMAVTMVATFSDNGSASASHTGNEICDVSTGHCYEVVSPVGGVSWTVARDAAAAMTHNVGRLGRELQGRKSRSSTDDSAPRRKSPTLALPSGRESSF